MTNETKDTGSISDGYHTFDELYEHRHALFLALMAYNHANEYGSWYSLQHDDGSSLKGWFIAGANLPKGYRQYEPITYHLPERLLPMAEKTGATLLEKAPKWDGHSSNDVISRLLSFATDYNSK